MVCSWRCGSGCIRGRSSSARARRRGQRCSATRRTWPRGCRRSPSRTRCSFETTHRLVAGRFIVEAKGAPALKGVRTPVAVYRVVQASGVRSRLAAAAARGLTPFVGREHERRLLRERFEQAREGKGQVVMIVGEPGIGKSRLAQVLHEDLAGVPHIWLESGGALYFANTPFYAVIGLLG